MKLRCSICKRQIDPETEIVVFFECYVFCDKCLQEMEEDQLRREVLNESEL